MISRYVPSSVGRTWIRWADAYSIGDAILETDELYFAITVLPVREEGQD